MLNNKFHSTIKDLTPVVTKRRVSNDTGHVGQEISGCIRKSSVPFTHLGLTDPTYWTLIRFLSAMNPHMYQQFVSRVERSSTWTTLPEARELVLPGSGSGVSVPVFFFVFVLVPVPLDPPAVSVRVRRRGFDVSSLYVTGQTLLFRERAATVYPSALIRRR